MLNELVGSVPIRLMTNPKKLTELELVGIKVVDS